MNVCVAAVITAAGSSARMGGLKKEYLALPLSSASDGAADNPCKTDEPLTVLGAAASAFADCPRVGLIAITTPPDAKNGEYAARKALPPALLRRTRPSVIFVPGGSSRRLSVYHALSTLACYRPDYVLIHDGARPWIKTSLIDSAIDAVLLSRAVIPVVPLAETPKEVECGFVTRHLRRASVVLAQTPQAFAFDALLTAHEKAAERELRGKETGQPVEYTDDAEIWGEFSGPVAVIEGDVFNRKITFPEDLPASGFYAPPTV
ncbi:MAG: 2-C-methyl-D-erythritol 4-phosphate cytidylyltransferase [Spirochaetaceae bacterium]|jgi:2-C-methyl-D-erythritol 4-phosphate cytidylyltransferase/2-C-methyl-D-erythritol 4-phosphate cytidylyltransferase/2-C-methyl-D-erythritol 2,4-cyclodiphosphate synthase|nr:2-C-methyl-D-erythritol 4-phosphate cytidylyltransferase [Spirochaetaceae bacterium]